MGVAGSRDGANGSPQAWNSVTAGHVAGDNRSTQQDVSPTERFVEQVEEAAQNLRKNFEEEASNNAQNVRRQ